MINEIKLLPGVKVLTKEEQKNLKGGRACCDPLIECCATVQMCTAFFCIGQGGCGSCCGGFCHSDYLYCGCV